MNDTGEEVAGNLSNCTCVRLPVHTWAFRYTRAHIDTEGQKTPFDCCKKTRSSRLTSMVGEHISFHRKSSAKRGAVHFRRNC